MKKLWMDLQLFADAGTLVNATGNYVNAYTGSTESFVPGTSDLSTLDKTYPSWASIRACRPTMAVRWSSGAGRPWASFTS